MNAKFTNQSNNALPPYRGYPNAVCLSSYWWSSLVELFWTDQFRMRKQMARWPRAHEDSLSVSTSIQGGGAHKPVSLTLGRTWRLQGGMWGWLANQRPREKRVRCSQRPSQGDKQKARRGHPMSSRYTHLHKNKLGHVSTWNCGREQWHSSESED